MTGSIQSLVNPAPFQPTLLNDGKEEIGGGQPEKAARNSGSRQAPIGGFSGWQNILSTARRPTQRKKTKGFQEILIPPSLKKQEQNTAVQLVRE